MKVTILALGSHGDVHPLIALGVGLQQAGHDVYIGAPQSLEKLIRNLGLQFILIRLDMQAIFQSEAGRAGLESGSNAASLFKNFAKATNARIPQAGVDCWQACQGSDVVIHSNVGFHFVPSIVEKLDIIDIAVFLHPIHPTKDFPSFLSPVHRNLGSTLNQLSYLVTDLMFGIPHRPAINQWRRTHLGLPPLGINYFRQTREQRKLTIYCFSPHVVPKPMDWGENIVVTDYLTLNHDSGWQPHDDLLDFLAAGDPPIYVGFGSMNTRNPKETADIVLKSLANTQQRGIIVSGWGELNDFSGKLPENIFKLEFAPFDWLFPKMAAVVHHGGAGTTGTGLRAGVPSIIVPFFFDQPFWGRRVAELGVGSFPIPRKKLSVTRLSSAIHTVMTDQGIRQRAVQLSQRLRAEGDGVIKTVAVINRYLSAKQ